MLKLVIKIKVNNNDNKNTYSMWTLFTNKCYTKERGAIAIFMVMIRSMIMIKVMVMAMVMFMVMTNDFEYFLYKTIKITTKVI